MLKQMNSPRKMAIVQEINDTVNSFSHTYYQGIENILSMYDEVHFLKTKAVTSGSKRIAVKFIRNLYIALK